MVSLFCFVSLAELSWHPAYVLHDFWLPKLHILSTSSRLCCSVLLSVSSPSALVLSPVIHAVSDFNAVCHFPCSLYNYFSVERLESLWFWNFFCFFVLIIKNSY